MRNADAEAERVDLPWCVHLARELLHHQSSAAMISGVQPVEIGQLVPRLPRPPQRLHLGLADTVVDAVILERDQQLPLERVPQPQLGCDPPAEVTEQRPAVGALGCRGQPDQHRRKKPGHHLLV